MGCKLFEIARDRDVGHFTPQRFQQLASRLGETKSISQAKLIVSRAKFSASQAKSIASHAKFALRKRNIFGGRVWFRRRFEYITATS
jgi:hypothetical protein